MNCKNTADELQEICKFKLDSCMAAGCLPQNTYERALGIMQIQTEFLYGRWLPYLKIHVNEMQQLRKFKLNSCMAAGYPTSKYL